MWKAQARRGGGGWEARAGRDLSDVTAARDEVCNKIRRCGVSAEKIS